jgi:D-glycero-D-manno-heptose 1,7-bisphosphate phosphatase
MVMNRKLVILDRDGVINVDSDAFIKSPDEWVAIPGSLEAIARLNQAGYRVAIASNQSGIGRGLITKTEAAAVHQRFVELFDRAGVRFAGSYYCPHAPTDECRCRKPSPQLILDAVHELGLDVGASVMIGDKASDLDAGRAAGCGRVLGFETSVLTWPNIVELLRD